MNISIYMCYCFIWSLLWYVNLFFVFTFMTFYCFSSFDNKYLSYVQISLPFVIRTKRVSYSKFCFWMLSSIAITKYVEVLANVCGSNHVNHLGPAHKNFYYCLWAHSVFQKQNVSHIHVLEPIKACHWPSS